MVCLESVKHSYKLMKNKGDLSCMVIVYFGLKALMRLDNSFDQDPLIRKAAHDEICDFVDKCLCSDYEYSQNLHVVHEECTTCTTMQEMFDEAKPQMLRDCRSESKRMLLGGKVLQCKVCSHKNASDPISCVSTIDVSNMVLTSLKKKCDEIHDHETNFGTYPSEDNITFTPLKERCDIMTYHYPLDNVSSNPHIYFNSDV